jgi:hypothetical protein
VDQSRAGFEVVNVSVGEATATVDVVTWFLYERTVVGLEGVASAMRGDRLHLVLTESGWRLDRVEPVSQS